MIPEYVIGVDPGMTGAWALLRVSPDPALVCVMDLPLRESFVGHKQELDVDVLVRDLLEMEGCFVRGVAMEWTWARTGQSIQAMFNFGATHGILLGVLSRWAPVRRFTPSTWKLAMGLSQDKQRSIEMAQRKFPAWREAFESHDGRAEAALLALYLAMLPEGGGIRL